MLPHDYAHRGIRSKQHHHHLHSLYRKQALNPETSDLSNDVDAIAQVTTTLSVVQQVGVDSAGSIISTATVLADSLSITAPTGLSIVGGSSVTDSATASTTNPSTSQSGSISRTTTPSQTQPSANQNSTSTLSSISSISNAPSTTATLAIGRNSTATPISASAQNATYSLSSSNITTTSPLSSTSATVPIPIAISSTPSSSTYQYTTFATLSSSSTYASQTTSGTTDFPTTTTSNSMTAMTDGSTTNSMITGSAAARTSTNAPPSSTTSGVAVGNVSNASDNVPSTGTIAGSVVGGVAGLSFLVLLIFMFLRWKRSNQSRVLLGDGADARTDRGTSRATTSSIAGAGTTSRGPMTQRSLFPFAIPAALTGHKRKDTQHSIEEPSLGSERGFYRVSGRQIASVLTSGGDGFGEDDPGPEQVPGRNTMSGGSFNRDSRGYYNGLSNRSPAPIMSSSFATAIPGSQPRDSVTPISRQGPARTPVISQSPFADPEPDSPTLTATSPRLRQPDAVGRSLVSQDGSHTSRFVEDI